MASQRELIDAETGQKFSSLGLLVGEAQSVAGGGVTPLRTAFWVDSGSVVTEPADGSIARPFRDASALQDAFDHGFVTQGLSTFTLLIADISSEGSQNLVVPDAFGGQLQVLAMASYPFEPSGGGPFTFSLAMGSSPAQVSVQNCALDAIGGGSSAKLILQNCWVTATAFSFGGSVDANMCQFAGGGALIGETLRFIDCRFFSGSTSIVGAPAELDWVSEYSFFAAGSGNQIGEWTQLEASQEVIMGDDADQVAAFNLGNVPKRIVYPQGHLTAARQLALSTGDGVGSRIGVVDTHAPGQVLTLVDQASTNTLFTFAANARLRVVARFNATSTEWELFSVAGLS